MAETSSRTLVCSVLFAELVDHARLPGEIEQDGGTWTAVCDSGGAGG
jgi:hypothetical protein